MSEQYLFYFCYAILAISVIVTIVRFFIGIDIFETTRPVLRVIERLLIVPENDLPAAVTVVLEDIDYLGNSCDIVFDRFYLYILFFDRIKFEKVTSLDFLSDRAKLLYEFGHSNDRIIQKGILGLLALQAKLSAVSCHPITLKIKTNNIEPYIDKIPNNINDLYLVTSQLHEICKRNKVDYNVYGSTPGDDFLILLTYKLKV